MDEEPATSEAMMPVPVPALGLSVSSDGLSIVSAKKMAVSLPARTGSWVLSSPSSTIAFSP